MNTPPPVNTDDPAHASGLLATIREALRGSHLDYTTAPVGRAVIMLAVPMVMEMAMESIFAVADVFWVAHLGADAVATVGLTESMLTIIYTAAMGLSIGATALVARRTGEHDPEGASRAAGQSVILGLVVALAIAAVAAPNASRLLTVMGASDQVVESGVGFTRVMLGGNATVLLLFMLNAVFRGSGDAAIAMRVLWIGNILNIILGPCFIFGLGPFPQLGVMGAAVATNLGRGTAVAAAIRRERADGEGARSARRFPLGHRIRLGGRLSFVAQGRRAAAAVGPVSACGGGRCVPRRGRQESEHEGPAGRLTRPAIIAVESRVVIRTQQEETCVCRPD